MIKKITILIATVFLTTFGSTAYADFSDGWDAATGGDYKTALKEWQPLADQGYAKAQYNLGLMHDNGNGVLKDDKQAVKWYQKAADQGFAKAQYNLGVVYANGTGELKDLSKAKYWINKAYENPDASTRTLRLADQGWNQLELWKYYQKAADRGHAKAQYNLGLMYDNGNGNGVLKDGKQAVKWYQKAADQGFAKAQHNLGVIYANGTGELKDLSKAKYWIKKAYENPDARASTIGLAEKDWNQFELWKY
ncbi:sel1 repeat family protein [Candidatus Thioglobus sp.]|jgi:TPR repeat protein|nr:sel1 repeat family protein [Candidatus Thioglobus sp.]